MSLNSEQKLNFSVSVLCSNRVSQMTKTYNDIEAVTRLLEEVRIQFYINCYHKCACIFLLQFFI